MLCAAGIHHLGRPYVTVDGFRYETPVEGIACRLDLVFAAGARFGFGDDPLIGRGKDRVPEIGVRFGCRAARQPCLMGCRPFPLEEIRQTLDGGGDTRQCRMPMFGVIDGGFQHLAHAHRAIVAQHQHPAVEGTGNDGCQQPVAWDQLQPFGSIMFNRGAWGRALCADDFDLVLLLRIKHGGHISARTAQMRLNNLEDKTGGDGGVESIAALFENGHANGRGDPVRGGDDAEGAKDFRACGEFSHSDIPCKKSCFARIERVTQAVAQKIETDDDEEDGDAGPHRHPRRLA